MAPEAKRERDLRKDITSIWRGGRLNHFYTSEIPLYTSATYGTILPQYGEAED